MFSSLELDLLLPIADKLILIDFETNEIVFDLGEQAFNMYIIGEGKVCYTRCVKTRNCIA